MVSTRSRTTASSPSPADRALKRGAGSDASDRPMKKKAAATATSGSATADGAVVGTRVTKEVTLRNHAEQEVAFVDTIRQQGAVFFMFPRANTPGCTTQACGTAFAFVSLAEKSELVLKALQQTLT